jgi:hypothetical protein
VATVAAWAAMGGSAAASGGCDAVASPDGSNSAPGTASEPLRTAQALLDSLSRGETGCLRTGDYRADNEIRVDTPGVTLTSFPGERAEVTGRVYVTKEAPNSTVSDLDIDGRNDNDLPSPTINGKDVTLAGNDITNHHEGICVSIGSLDTWGRADRALIRDNRIHDCGRLPATNYDHGIYLVAGDDVVIRDNYIYDNADRGIQLYPDAQNTRVTGNVIDGNGSGVIMSGAGNNASSGTVIANNVITNSRIRDNVESYWESKVGHDNIVHDNCIGGGANDDGDGGILHGSGVGFKAHDNLLKVPDYANRAAGDFRIPASSPCASILRGASRSKSAPAKKQRRHVVKIDVSKKVVHASRTVAVSGRARGANHVRVVIRREDGWHTLERGRTKNRRYNLRIRLDHPGRQTIKAEAAGLKDSKRVSLQVEG